MRTITVLALAAAAVATQEEERALFAAGCFWSVELAYQRVPGVLRTAVGYAGGDIDNPTYQTVSSGTTGHAEAVEVIFDPSVVSYRRLVDLFWLVIRTL
jgi:methionine-S-sulfoxide reductase